MVNPIEALKEVLDGFDHIGIDYFVVGSVAAMFYSRPRFTNDIDLVAQIKPEQISKFEETFPLKDFYCPPLEILRDEVVKRGQFNLIHHSSGMKIDVVLTKNTDFSRSEFSRRRKVKYDSDFSLFIASPEDIVIKKLDFFRQGGSEKHLSDIRGIFAETEIDKVYLDFWIKKLGLNLEWEKV